VPAIDPNHPRQRIVVDASMFDRSAPLKEIATGHLAAV
jgi:hypothetical protein